jgi:hypothetical protein
MLQTPATLYFVVYNRVNNVFGYTWRIGTSGTSFYIKARAPYIGAVKISLHGPDPRPHLSAPGFKLAIDRSALPAVRAAGGAVVGFLPDQGQWFTGREVLPGVRHVMTFRSTPDLFVPGASSAANPGQFKVGREQGLVIPAPQALQAADVDVFVSDGVAYWFNPVKALPENACFGPIKNKAGQLLTCQSVRRPVIKCPIHIPEPLSNADRVRGLATYLNGQGVLIIHEAWMSREFLRESVRGPGMR